MSASSYPTCRLGSAASLIALSLGVAGSQAFAAERSTALRQQPGSYLQVAQAQGQQQGRVSNWSYTAGASLHYDSFESDDDFIESDQLSELFSFTGSRNNLWYDGDSLSLSVNFGFAQAWPERGGNRDSISATPLDTQLTAAYSTWDKKTSGVTAKVFMNIPTGPSDLSLTELAAIPNPKLVSAQVLSEGFQVGGQAQYHRQIEKWHLRGGPGYTYRSGITGFNDFETEELGGGHDISVFAGADYQINERLNIGIELEYTYSIEEEAGHNHFVGVSIPLTYLFPRGEFSLTYSFSFSSGENRELTRAFRGQDEYTAFLDGLRHTLVLDAGYRVIEPLLVNAFIEGSIGNGGRSDDPAFFTTDDYILVGVGANYTLAQNLALQGRLKYFDVSTKGADGGTTTFEGFSAMLGLKYGF